MIRLTPALLLLSGGCAADLSGYPSLAPRAAEQVSLTAALPETSVPGAPASAEQLVNLASVRRDALAGQALFDRMLPEAKRAVADAAGMEFDSIPWTVAQQAISRLEEGSLMTAAAVADADRTLADLRLTAAQEPATPGLVETQALRNELSRLHDGQAATVTGLQATLR